MRSQHAASLDSLTIMKEGGDGREECRHVSV